jgi:hypothetical protein
MRLANRAARSFSSEALGDLFARDALVVDRIMQECRND